MLKNVLENTCGKKTSGTRHTFNLQPLQKQGGSYRCYII